MQSSERDLKDVTGDSGKQDTDRIKMNNMKSILKKNRIIIRVLAMAAAALLLTACSAGAGSSAEDAKSCSRDIFAMDTYMSITCYGERAEEAADAAEAEIKRLDELLSVGNPDSEISRINQKKEGVLSEDSRIMVERSLKIFEDTKGAFDITVFPLMELWGFTSGEYHVPSREEREDILIAVGSDQLTYKDGTLTLGPAQGIDLGGIAKGYTSDRLMEIFAAYDLDSAMISLGGNVELFNAKPDGSLWKCGIQDPHNKDAGKLLGVLQAESCAVITSGAYERFFEDQSGHTYHHIVDPATGCPADSGLISVSIVSKEGILADGLSTAVYVMGLNNAIDYWRASDEEFDMILMTDKDEVYITEALADYFQTDYPLHIIQ